jgi:CheY-like chemotaxis protein
MTKILLVEDNPDSLRVLAICLQLEEFAVQQAHDGLEAFQKPENQTFDVVVSDVRMPRLSRVDSRSVRRDANCSYNRGPESTNIGNR